ncbi:MAG: DNA-directed RNA polymerase subunit beta, partial [Acidimicrobiales bacterium]
MPSRSRTPERFSFANLGEVLPLPDLISVQRDSFQWFLERGLAETFADISPITDFTDQLRLELKFDPKEGEEEELRPPPKFTIDECKQKDITYAAPIFVRASFGNASTGEIKEQTVFMGDFPMMTERGTFIINGTERVVVSQLVRSPGVIFQPGRDQKTIVTGTIHPYRGEWIEFDVEAKPSRDVTAGARVARKRRLSLFVVLRALGFTDEAFLSRFVTHFDFLSAQWERERELVATQEEALLEIYKRARPGEPLSLDAARAYFENAFFNARRYDLTRVGRYKLNRKLGPEIDRIATLLDVDLERPKPDQGVLSPSEVLAAATYMLHLANGEPGYRLDDQDHFANRRIRSVGELIQNQVRIGLSRMERVVRERMTTQDVEAITPQTLINIRPVVAAIKEFFGTSQLSQFMDQHNPLSGLAHKRRLSALGPGGLSRERAGFEVRDVHTSHYGRMCPIETPEGPNIGLIGHLATYARVNEHGFIETPYRKVSGGRVTNEITYLAADEEEEYVIAQASAALDAEGAFVEDRVLVRRGPQGAGVRVGATSTSYGTTSEVDFVPPADVDLMDVSPKQILSVSTALIPFIEHDDANRALMGANMQKQAVPLLVPEAPYIGTGIEARAARDAGELVIAEEAGTVTEVAGDHITIEYRPDKGRPAASARKVVYPMWKFQRSNQNTCI